MKTQFATLLRRRVGLALLVVILLSIPTGYGLAQDTMVVVGSGALDVGATTTVNISVENVTDLYGLEVHLTFDPALLEVEDADTDAAGVQIQSGTFLSPDFVAQNAVDQAAGKIDFAIAQMPPHEPVSGSGVLATITFKGKAAGTCALGFSNVILSDRNGNAINTGTRDGSVTVNADTPTLTPTSTPDTPTPTSTSSPTPTPSPTPTSGPTPTPSPTPTSSPTPTPSPTLPPSSILGYHTVQSGETLYCIARAYGVDPYAIATQNGILNPNIIHVGQVLAIPAIYKSLPAGRVCPRQFDGGTPTPPTCRWYHTVVWGENLYRIALRYGVSMWAIAEVNGITNLSLIYAGQVLCIP